MEDLDAVRSRFASIYASDEWDGGSGPGSFPSSTIEYRAFLERFMHENHVSSVTDLGCGDWQFSRFMDWSGIDYTGYDLVPALVDRNTRAFSAPNIKFRVFENFGSLPGGDLLVAKEVLQHLPNRVILEFLEVLPRKYKFMLLTNSVAPGQFNGDIPVGGWRPLRLEAAPFQARGAVVFSYTPRNNHHMWRNSVFLMLGTAP